jgi:hypothetical protein
MQGWGLVQGWIKHAVGGALIAVLSAGVASIVTAQSTAPTQIFACVQNNGEIRIVSAGTTCASNRETLVTWNTQGTPGAPGVSGYEIASRSFSVTTATNGNTSVACPTGKKALGGGGRTSISGTDDGIVGTYPDTGGTGWVVNYATSGASTITLYAICANVT